LAVWGLFFIFAACWQTKLPTSAKTKPESDEKDRGGNNV